MKLMNGLSANSTLPQLSIIPKISVLDVLNLLSNLELTACFIWGNNIFNCCLSSSVKAIGVVR